MSEAPEKYTLTKGQKFYSHVKRVLDFVLSLLAMIILSPLLAGIYIAIKCEDGWKKNAIFDQTRIGVDQKRFNLYKFRSMKTDAPHDLATHLLEHPEQYVTKVGKFLRKTSLDELPQLINILKGEMSLCGPRPALWNQYDLIAERDKYGANDVMPGLTGWAQVNGRDALEIEEKARYDGEYAQKLSFGLDLKIFVMTIINVLRHSDVVEGGTGTLKGADK